MSFYRKALKYGPVVAFTASPAIVMAQASEIVTAATTALGSTQDDATSVGSLIIGVVAVIAAIGIVLALLRKA